MPMSPGPPREADPSAVEAAAAGAAAAMAAAAESLQARLELVLDERLGALTADQRGFLRVAKKDGERLLKLIGDFYEIALADAGLLELEWGRTDLAAAVGEAVDAYAARANVLGKRIAVSAAGPSVVVADARRITDAVGRLVRFAVQQSAQGSTVDIQLLGRGMVVRYEAEEPPAPDAIAVAFSTAIARAHGGGLTVSFDGAAVELAFEVCAADGAVVQISVAA